MPAPFGYGLWLWLKDNEYARWIVGGGLAALIIYILDKLRITRIRKEAVRKANDRAEKQSKQILEDMEDDINETVEAADRAAERVPSGLDSTSLPKRLRRFVKYTGGSDSGSEREG